MAAVSTIGSLFESLKYTQPADLPACERCGKVPHREDYHVKKLPIGTPGRHVSRALCDCGCKAVSSYFVLDRLKVKSRCTASLKFVEALSDEALEHDPVIEVFSWP